jgi:hypothetical protein
MRLDPALRAQKRHQWNQPVWWPVGVIGVVLVTFVVPAVIAYRRREKGRPC